MIEESRGGGGLLFKERQKSKKIIPKKYDTQPLVIDTQPLVIDTQPLVIDIS